MKTLKDLTEKVWNTEVTPEEYFVTVDNLRQEAIKWVKEIHKTQNKIPKNTPCYERLDGKIDFIVRFFNLTDEELV